MTYLAGTAGGCLLAFAVLTSGRPSVDEDISPAIQSESVDGYDTGTVHLVDSTTQEETRLSQRDLQSHVADLSSNQRTYSLHLSSGQQLRMSVSRRSNDTSGTVTSTEPTENGDPETPAVSPPNCSFSGVLQNEEGFVRLSFCDLKLVGSVSTPFRNYQIQTLPIAEGITESEYEVMHVLVTWQDLNQGTADVNNTVQTPQVSSVVDDSGTDLP